MRLTKLQQNHRGKMFSKPNYFSQERKVRFVQPINDQDYQNSQRGYYTTYDPVQIAYTFFQNERLQEQNSELKQQNILLQRHIKRIENNQRIEEKKQQEAQRLAEIRRYNEAIVIGARVRKMKEEWEERDIRQMLDDIADRREEREAKRRQEAYDKYMSMKKIPQEINVKNNKDLEETNRQEGKEYIKILNKKKTEEVRGLERHLDKLQLEQPRECNCILFFASTLFIFSLLIMCYCYFRAEFSYL